MKINFLTGSLLVAVSVFALSSCSGDDEPGNENRNHIETVTSPEGYSFIAPDDAPLNGFTSPTAKYEIEFFDNRTADIHIKNISLLPGTAPADIDITAVPYKKNAQGVYVIDASNITADGGAVRFRDIDFTYSAISKEHVSDANASIFTFEAETNTDVCLTFVPYEIVAGGTTVVTGGPGRFTSNETTYNIYIDIESGKARLTVRNAKFAQNMPAVGDMVFADLDITYEDEGGYHLSSRSLVPTIGGVPYPSFAISNFYADVDLESMGDVDISFQCNAMGQNYTVRADDLTYYSLGSR